MNVRHPDGLRHAAQSACAADAVTDAPAADAAARIANHRIEQGTLPLTRPDTIATRLR